MGTFRAVLQAASGCPINDAIHSSVRSALVNPLSGIYTPSTEGGEEQPDLWGGREELLAAAGPEPRLRGGVTAVEPAGTLHPAGERSRGKHPGLRKDVDFPKTPARSRRRVRGGPGSRPPFHFNLSIVNPGVKGQGIPGPVSPCRPQGGLSVSGGALRVQCHVRQNEGVGETARRLWAADADRLAGSHAPAPLPLIRVPTPCLLWTPRPFLE